MSELGSLLGYLRDPKLTAHATGALPAWLWSVDATQVLWVNPTAAAIFDVPSPAALAGYVIDPKGSAALQIARIAGTLPQGGAPRLERLRGFGGSLGRALMCACSRVILEDRTPAILVVATESAGAGLPLDERVRRLCIGIEEPIALFAPDGELIHATAAGEAQLLGLKSIAALGAGELAEQALLEGRAAGASHLGAISLERIGSEASVVLLAAFAQAVAPAEPVASEAAPTQPVGHAAAPIAEPPSPEVSLPEPADAEPEPPPIVAVPEPPNARTERRYPMRFVWQMDAAGGMTLGSEEFAAVIGPQSAAALKRPWREIAAELHLDPEGQVQRAIASQDTWSGISVAFPIDGTDARLPVELSGLPVFDRERNFHGYRGFGVCRARAADRRARSRPSPPNPNRRERQARAARAAGDPRGAPGAQRGAAGRERAAVPRRRTSACREIAEPHAGRTPGVSRTGQQAHRAAARSAKRRGQRSHLARHGRAGVSGAAGCAACRQACAG